MSDALDFKDKYEAALLSPYNDETSEAGNSKGSGE